MIKLLQTEEAYQILLHPNQEIKKNEILKIQIAKELEQFGLFDLTKEHSIPCIDPENESLYEHVPDSECDEIIPVRTGATPYSNKDLVVCPKCGHEFFISEHSQNIMAFYRLTTKKDVILGIFENCLSEQNIIWHKLDLGKYVVIYNSETKVWAITDFFLKTSVENDWILFHFQIGIPLKKSFPLANFICKRRLFSEIWEHPGELHSSKLQCPVPQLVISSKDITLGGKLLISAQSTRQWQLFQLFLANQGKILSLSKIAEMLQKQGEFVDDFENQIRRAINRLRAKTESLGHSKNTLITSLAGGYSFNEENLQVIYID